MVTNIVASGTGYLLGAILYLFVASLFQKPNRKSIIYCLLPFLVHLLFINIPFLLSNPADGYYFNYLSFVERYGDEVYLVEIVCFFLYIYFAYRIVVNSAPLLSSYYSHITQDQINWVKYMLWGVFGFILIDFCQTVYLSITNDSGFPEVEVTLFSSAFIIAFITYHGLYLSKILLPENLAETLQEKKGKKSAAINKSTFSEIEIGDLKDKLNQALTIKKVYLQDSLTLSNLAEEMSVPEKKLSYFINQVLNTNFYELINSYRLDDFKKRVVDTENRIYSIVAIAHQCGFKSKTSFYAFFKKKEGLTPSQFLKQMSENGSSASKRTK